MSYTLIGSLTSPYVRKLRLCFYKKISYELKTINYLEEHDSNYLKQINPINKIPILLDHDTPIFDSRVIYNYISEKHNWTPLTISEENILSAIDGLLDTSINLFTLKRGGLDLDGPNTYIARQKERIPLILHYLTPWAQRTTDWNFLSMSLYSYLDWASFREIIDIKAYPEMQQFLDKFKNASGVEETKIIT
jgi:glutathione S-transferase